MGFREFVGLTLRLGIVRGAFGGQCLQGSA